MDEKDIIYLGRYFSNSYTESINLNGGHNSVYLIKGDCDFVLRITSIEHRKLSDIESELDFLRYLKRNEVSLAAPLKGLDDKFAYEIQLNNKTLIISAFEKANGLDWKNRGCDDRECFLSAGEMIGKMHKESKRYKPLNIKTRRHWNESQHLIRAKSIFDKHRPDINKAFSKFLAKMDELPQNSDSFGLIHGDYFFANYLFSESKIILIDFDECEYSWFMYDIAVCMYYFLLGPDPSQLQTKRDEAIEIFLWLMEGYTKENNVCTELLEKMDYFFQLRDYVLLSTYL